MSRRWTRHLTVAVAAVLLLGTAGCLGSPPIIIDSYTEVPSGIVRCVTANSTISSTLNPSGDITATGTTQARKNPGCANAESGIGPWDFLEGQVTLKYLVGTSWNMCASTWVHSTTTAQAVLPNIAHECGTTSYKVVGMHWTSVGGYNTGGMTTTPTVYIIA